MNRVIEFPTANREPAAATVAATQPVAQSVPAESDRSLDLRWLVGVLRRRKVSVLACVLLIPIAVTALVLNLTPRYATSARLVIEGQRENVVDIEAVQQGISFDYTTIETEAEVLRSREVAIDAVKILGLRNDPNFNPMLKPVAPKKTWRQKIEESIINYVIMPIEARTGIKILPKWLEPVDPQNFIPPNLTEPELEEIMVGRFLGGLSVTPSDIARVITIKYTSVDPIFAATAANSLAEVYIDRQRVQKVRANERASVWLEERVNSLRDLVVDSQRKLEEFKQFSGIIEIGGLTSIRQQIGQLNSRIIDAETQHAEKSARFEQVTELIKRKGGLESAADVLDSALIKELRIEEIRIRSQIFELRTIYRDTHPKVILANNQLKDIQDTVKGEVDKILASLRSEADVARARVDKLQETIDRLREQYIEESDAEVTLRSLETEVKANSQLYEVLLDRLKETDVQDGSLQTPEARIITRAVVPATPVFPRKRIMIFASIVVSFVLGVLIAVAQEYFIAGYRTIRDIETDTGFTVLSTIPWEQEIAKFKHPMYRFLLERPHSRLSESVRKLRTALSLTMQSRRSKAVLITSAERSEGKSSLVLGLAAVASRAGERVLVLDCDMRMPTVHSQLSVSNSVGMTDMLSGQTDFESVIEFDASAGFYYVTVGQRGGSSEDLLASENMVETLEIAKRSFDLILLDVPPVLSVADASVLMDKVDQSVLCVKWEGTSRESVKRALRTMLDSGAQIPGIMLTQIDMNIQRTIFGRDDSYYYYDPQQVAG